VLAAAAGKPVFAEETLAGLPTMSSFLRDLCARGPSLGLIGMRWAVATQGGPVFCPPPYYIRQNLTAPFPPLGATSMKWQYQIWQSFNMSTDVIPGVQAYFTHGSTTSRADVVALAGQGRWSVCYMR
jgi:hypothetical protein